LDEHTVLVFGVLNVTPDSFSDGGLYADAAPAIEHGLRLAREGADVVDVGGESTRPRGAVYGEGYADVDADEESRRVVPVVRALARAGVRVSVDTTKAEVARAALEAGAQIVNDTSCGASSDLLRAVAEHHAELVLMHNRGRGEAVGENASYQDVVAEVCDALERAVTRAAEHGVSRERVWVDPGLGFAKTAAHSLALHAALHRVVALGHPVLLGASRKAFLAGLGARAGETPSEPRQRLPETIASALFGARAGVRAVRVHDVREVTRALRTYEALTSAEAAGSAPCT
jgi:dihydropteroate synthase